ncbi:MAG: M55 family metallopeptidase [Gemmatimonadota bacterium]
MRIYILADMEGISGIRNMDQVKTESGGEYQHGRQLMMQDINNAVDACFAAGADEVVACDTHGGGGQVQISEMDPRALYETPNVGNMMPALDATYDGVILLGHHARAGTRNGFLDHTMSSASWFEYRINGVEVGEIGIEAAYAGHFGVPVVVVTGDQAACDEAVALFGRVECGVVKWGIGRNRARCLPLPRAHAAVRQAIATALGRLSQYRPYQPELPAVVQLTLYRSDMADDYEARGLERVDARTVRRTVDSLARIRI